MDFLANSLFSCRSSPRQKTSSSRTRIHENCVVAVFELERITGVAELNEGCRRARLLRDRCCHGDTNPVLRQFTISTRALHRSLRPPGKARSISAITRSHVSMAILYRDKKGSLPFFLRTVFKFFFLLPGKKSAQSSPRMEKSDPKQHFEE